MGKHKLPPNNVANDIYLSSADARTVGRKLSELMNILGIKHCDLVAYLYITKVCLYRILHGMIRSKKSYRFIQLGVNSIYDSRTKLDDINHSRYITLNDDIEELLLKETY